MTEPARDEQRKMIKYNRNAGNILVLHTAVRMSEGMERLRAKGKGHLITDETLAGISPYLTEHIARFGAYEFDMTTKSGEIPAGIFSK